MQLIKLELKNRAGLVELKPEFPEDLWGLGILIKPGDLVYSITTRKQSPAQDRIRPQDLERIPVKLGVQVEQLEFDGFSKRLRIRGKIVQGTDLGHYHTINLYQQPIAIQKQLWREYELRLISKLRKSCPQILGLTLDEYDAEAAYLRGYGMELIFQIQKLGRDRAKFFQRISEALSKLGFDRLILAGPGFTKQDFQRYLSQRFPEFASKLILEETNSVGIPGFRELISAGALTRAGSALRLESQIKAIQELIEELSRNGNAAYGLDAVKTYAQLGCIRKLLVIDKLLVDREVDELLGELDPTQLMILSTQHEWGAQLESLGGIAALLRFKPAWR